MRQASLYRYSLPIKTGVVLRGCQLLQRQGLFLHLQQDGLQGWGEIAPLPGFSDEGLVLAETQLRTWIKDWQSHCDVHLDHFSPSVAFGVSMALAELDGILPQAGNFDSAILCDGNLEKWQSKLAETKKPKVAKLKVGRGDPADEGELVARFLSENPEVQLRLDANRAWSLAQAVAFSEKIAKSDRLQIQFIEEPCKTAEQSREFAQLSGIQIAWDESLREAGFVLNAEPNLAAIVLKPTLTGSLEKCVKQIEHAASLGLKVVISSSLETSLGLSQLARLAYQQETFVGLDTLELMTVQLLRTWPGSRLPLVGLDSGFVRALDTSG